MRRYCKVIEEGPKDFFFDGSSSTENDDESGYEDLEFPTEIVSLINHGRNFDDLDILQARASVQMDDDNHPAPENATLVAGDLNVTLQAK